MDASALCWVSLRVRFAHRGPEPESTHLLAGALCVSRPHPFPVGLILIAAGFLLFLIAAFQIYSAKLLKKGLVDWGIYKKFRHPQYLALSVFCIGIILTWGRFITFIAFFIMLWFYYLLAKSEERKCEATFGERYRDYRRRTYFLFPSETMLAALDPKASSDASAKKDRSPLFFLYSAGRRYRRRIYDSRDQVEHQESNSCNRGRDHLVREYEAPIRLLMVKGPALQGWPTSTTQLMGRKNNVG